MESKLILRIAVKTVLAGLLIGSAIGDVLSTRLTADDFADEYNNPLDLGRPVPVEINDDTH